MVNHASIEMVFEQADRLVGSNVCLSGFLVRDGHRLRVVRPEPFPPTTPVERSIVLKQPGLWHHPAVGRYVCFGGRPNPVGTVVACGILQSSDCTEYPFVLEKLTYMAIFPMNRPHVLSVVPMNEVGHVSQATIDEVMRGELLTEEEKAESIKREHEWVTEW